jgi:hypothetical protein
MSPEASSSELSANETDAEKSFSRGRSAKAVSITNPTNARNASGMSIILYETISHLNSSLKSQKLLFSPHSRYAPDMRLCFFIGK